jgi:F-type H+-transporting ATPase subunit b
MNIIPDLVLTAWLIPPFLVLVFGMQAILYKPMIAYLDARQNATVGARKGADELRARASERLGEWEAALAKANGEVADFRAQRRAVAQAKYQQIVAEAKAASETRIEAALEGIRGEAAAARGGLDREARALSQDVAVRVLGRPVAQVEA